MTKEQEPRSLVEQLLHARPVTPLPPATGAPDWQEIILLFERHKTADPHLRLRDELVSILQWARYAETLDAALSERPTRQSDPHWYDMYCEARDELAALPSAPEPVAGWKLVPIKPTQAMINRGSWHRNSERLFWAAMLEAAPAAPVQEGPMAKLSDTEVDNWLEKQWSETDPRTRSNLLAELTAKDSTIAALTAERDEARKELDERLDDLGRVIMACPMSPETRTAPAHIGVRVMRSRLDAAKARIAVLEKALEPFAASPRGLEITIEQIDAARAALGDIQDA